MKQDIEKIISLLFDANRILRERSVKNGTRYSLLNQRVLDFVFHKKNPTMKEVAEFLCIKSPTATSIINTLVKNGKIKRVSDKADYRIVRLSLTQSGRKMLSEQKREMTKNIKKDLKKINGKEKKDLIKILEKLI